MTRRRVTVELDGELVAAAQAAAERAGLPRDAVYERALREVLVRDFAALMEEVARDQATRDVALSDEQAMRLVNEELRAARAERRSS